MYFGSWRVGWMMNDGWLLEGAMLWNGGSDQGPGGEGIFQNLSASVLLLLELTAQNPLDDFLDRLDLEHLVRGGLVGVL